MGILAWAGLAELAWALALANWVFDDYGDGNERVMKGS
jgi:hypothetical protein